MDSKDMKLEEVPTESKEPLDLLFLSEHQETSPGEQKKLLLKVDVRLLPLLCITYALQAIDKTTLSYAGVFDIEQDLHLTGSDFSWAGGILYIGYLIWEFPTNLLLQRYPINTVMASTAIVWGAILCCHAATTNFTGLMLTRLFLGALESSINPGTMLLFSMYYERREQPLRMGIWIGSAGVGYIIAGIASFGLGHIDSSLASWRILFLFWGSVTILFGIVLMWILPGSPLKAKFLSDSERAMVISHIKTNGTGVENKQFKWPQFWEAITDVKTWLLFLFAIVSNSPNGGLTVFQGLIIKGMGFSTLRTTLYQMPSGAVQAVMCPLVCYLASRYRNARIAIMLGCLLPFLAGVLGLWLVDESRHYVRLACLWISFTYTASWTLSMSIATANTAGHTKKITTNALLIIGYCLGNFIGPLFFKKSQSPRYTLGVGMMMFCVGMQIICLALLLVLFWKRNHGEDRQDCDSPASQHEAYERGLLDQTELENKFFKVSQRK